MINIRTLLHSSINEFLKLASSSSCSWREVERDDGVDTVKEPVFEGRLSWEVVVDGGGTKGSGLTSFFVWTSARAVFGDEEADGKFEGDELLCAWAMHCGGVVINVWVPPQRLLVVETVGWGYCECCWGCGSLSLFHLFPLSLLIALVFFIFTLVDICLILI